MKLNFALIFCNCHIKNQYLNDIFYLLFFIFPFDEQKQNLSLQVNCMLFYFSKSSLIELIRTIFIAD